jgi:hypothetical protein
MVLYGIAREPVTALVASATAGASWIVALATLSVSAQVALPDWVRARGLALYTTVFFGCLTLGSAAWGEIAAAVGLANAHFLASAGAVAATALTWPWKLQTGASIDLSPSMHWPAPLTVQPIEHNRGPVLVTVEYRINPRDLCVGRVRRYRRSRPDGRDFPCGILDGAFAPARARHQCRPAGAGMRASVQFVRPAESDAFHRRRTIRAEHHRARDIPINNAGIIRLCTRCVVVYRRTQELRAIFTKVVEAACCVICGDRLRFLGFWPNTITTRSLLYYNQVQISAAGPIGVSTLG